MDLDALICSSQMDWDTRQ